jgi:hypothetical protein
MKRRVQKNKERTKIEGAMTKKKSEKKKFKVEVWEYERGWGSKIDEIREFDSQQAAEIWVKSFNAHNNLSEVPDWYMVAKPGNFEMGE